MIIPPSGRKQIKPSMEKRIQNMEYEIQGLKALGAQLKINIAIMTNQFDPDEGVACYRCDRKMPFIEALHNIPRVLDTVTQDQWSKVWICRTCNHINSGDKIHLA